MAVIIVKRSKEPEDRSTKWERLAKEFDSKNPHVFPELERICAEVRDAGVKRCGFEMIIGQFRWRSMMRTSGDQYKINQNFAAYYSRKMMRVHPEWAGMFNTRQLRGSKK
jgi:hypothetical protein